MALTPTKLVLGAAATARLARLVTTDTIFSSPRLRYVQKMDRTGHPKLAELAVCPWCVSVWIGAALAVAADRDLPGYDLITAAPAFSLAVHSSRELSLYCQQIGRLGGRKIEGGVGRGEVSKPQPRTQIGAPTSRC